MRRLTLSFALTCLFAVPAIRAAEAPASRAETLQASDQLVRAAKVEAGRLRAAEQVATGRKPAAATQKISRRQQLRAKLLESERLRIRDRYRNSQQERIAAHQLSRLAKEGPRSARPTSVTAAD